MRIVHRFGFNVDQQLRDCLRELGLVSIAPPNVPVGFCVIELAEDDPRWRSASDLLAARRPTDVVWTEFSDREIEAADSLRLASDWLHGYPQPEDTYERATYDLGAHCPECGIGAKQRAPFAMKKEPKWGKKTILQLNWVFDQHFVKPELWEAVFKPRGVECMPVKEHGSKRDLNTVVQLVIPDLDIEVNAPACAAQRCPRCDRVKYVPHVRGPFPALRSKPADVPIFRAATWFGSGASANRPVFVSREFRAAMQAYGANGAAFIPVAEG